VKLLLEKSDNMSKRPKWSTVRLAPSCDANGVFKDSPGSHGRVEEGAIMLECIESAKQYVWDVQSGRGS
jgi:hypothetical protein